MRLRERLTYVLEGKSKFFRPLLLLTFSRLSGCSAEDALMGALAVEYIHAASLIHDDIIDAADVRRGNITAHKKWDTKEALLAGDVLYARAFQIIGSLKCEEATSVLAGAVSNLSMSELEQLTAEKTISLLTQTESYYTLIRNKTAVLFEASCELAVLLGGGSDTERKQAKRFGDEFGMAFQLTDDCHDYFLKNEIFPDLMQGNITLPLILAYRVADAAEKNKIEKMLQDIFLINATAHSASDLPDVSDIINMVKRPEVVLALKEEIEEYLTRARESLRPFQDCPEKTSLIFLTKSFANDLNDSLKH